MEEILTLQDNKHISLDKELVNGERITLIEKLETEPNNENRLLKESLTKEIDRVLKVIPNITERQIIILFFGLNGEKQLNIKEISELLNIKESTVRVKKGKAIRRLKTQIPQNFLKEYL